MYQKGSGSILISTIILMSAYNQGSLMVHSSNAGEVNYLSNAASGSGSSNGEILESGRGSGMYSGSGISGTLPPCTECFGHGTNPDSNPKCKLGCRGTIMHASNKTVQNLGAESGLLFHNSCEPGNQCPDEFDPLSKPETDGQNVDAKSPKNRLKFAIISVTIVGCVTVLIILTIKQYLIRNRQVQADIPLETI